MSTSCCLFRTGGLWAGACGYSGHLSDCELCAHVNSINAIFCALHSSDDDDVVFVWLSLAGGIRSGFGGFELLRRKSSGRETIVLFYFTTAN